MRVSTFSRYQNHHFSHNHNVNDFMIVYPKITETMAHALLLDDTTLQLSSLLRFFHYYQLSFRNMIQWMATIHSTTFNVQLFDPRNSFSALFEMDDKSSLEVTPGTLAFALAATAPTPGPRMDFMIPNQPA